MISTHEERFPCCPTKVNLWEVAELSDDFDFGDFMEDAEF